MVGSEAGHEPFVDRISMTLPRLCNTHELLFLVVGEEKADAAARAFAGEPTHAIPGSLARATEGTTRAVLDRAAAGEPLDEAAPAASASSASAVSGTGTSSRCASRVSKERRIRFAASRYASASRSTIAASASLTSLGKSLAERRDESGRLRVAVEDEQRERRLRSGRSATPRRRHPPASSAQRRQAVARVVRRR